MIFDCEERMKASSMNLTLLSCWVTELSGVNMVFDWGRFWSSLDEHEGESGLQPDSYNYILKYMLENENKTLTNVTRSLKQTLTFNCTERRLTALFQVLFSNCLC